ncbi:MAG: redoxin domain-containing protein [Nitrospirae bacterium]|nr:redoxin domain-containing protein [Nitrospirota bacterium]
MKRGKIFIFAIILLSLLAALFIKIKSDKKSAEAPGISTSPAVSLSLPEMLASLNMTGFPEIRKAPEFELTSLEGEKISLSQFHGKAVMLSFWATW